MSPLIRLQAAGVAFVFFFATASAASSKLRLLDTYLVRVPASEKGMVVPASFGQTAVLAAKGRKVIVIATDFPPQSLRSARLRAEEMSVKAADVQVVRQGKFALFYFETDGVRYVYSTRGGRLTVNARRAKDFEMSRIELASANSGRKK